MSSRSPAARVARRLDARGIHYGWVIAAVSFLTLITAAGFRSTVGVLIVPLQDEFGWSRATISAAVAINLVLYGLGGPFAAGLYDRFGIRRVIVIALATIAISSTLTTQIDAPWQLDLIHGSDRRPRHGLSNLDVLAAHVELLHLRRDHERPHRHPPDPGP